MIHLIPYYATGDMLDLLELGIVSEEVGMHRKLKEAFSMPRDVVVGERQVQFPMEWFLETLESNAHFRSFVDLETDEKKWEGGVSGGSWV